MTRVVLFRADGDAAIGLGHVMRCVALAEAMIGLGAECHFATCAPSDALAARLSRSGIIVHTIDSASDQAADRTNQIAREIGARGLVADGYHYTDLWWRNLGNAGLPVLAFADGTLRPPHADLLIDASVAPSNDPAELFGRDFILLRGELVNAARLAPLPMSARRSILVTFGGSDPAGLTLPVATALRAVLPAVPQDVVIGGAVRNAAAIAAALQALGGDTTIHLAPEAMGDLMRRAGLAVTAGGSTVGELAAVGVAALIVVVADNQLATAQACEEVGWCSYIDARVDVDAASAVATAAAGLWRDATDRERRVALGRHFVDADGADRVASAFLSYVERHDKS